MVSAHNENRIYEKQANKIIKIACTKEQFMSSYDRLKKIKEEAEDAEEYIPISDVAEILNYGIKKTELMINKMKIPIKLKYGADAKHPVKKTRRCITVSDAEKVIKSSCGVSTDV